MPFTFTKLNIPEVVLIEPKLFFDSRGYFFENFKQSLFKENGINTFFVQDNISNSTKDVLRGLHYQKEPYSQAKLVTVLMGEIFDVAVDIRKNSPTYGKWIGEILSQENHKSLYIPEGFAHGFCVLSEQADVLYKVGNEYNQKSERGIIWNDPKLGITWPISEPLVSDKDQKFPTLENSDNDF